MPPTKTQINCPQCRQPVIAQVEQLFDVTADPGAKQRLLSGVSNYAICQHCGFNGSIATLIVYHDTSKELLLTYFPPELNMPANEQEKMVGPLINQVVNKLPPEKRKAYLFSPQSFLTYQSLIEKILAADGISPEMLKEQQDRVALIERLLSITNPDTRSEVIKQESPKFDMQFFALFGKLIESAIASGQEIIAKQMDELQNQLLAETEYGRALATQANELQEAVKSLQSAGKELDREKLMDILIEAPNDDRLNALVSLTRPGIDYSFFQMLSERIEKVTGDEKAHLEALREKLLGITKQIDQRVEQDYKQANALLELIISSEDIDASLNEHLGEISETFIQVLNHSLQEANKKNDTELMPKLQKIVGVIQNLTAPPPELALLEKLLDTPDDSALNALLVEHEAEITPEFIGMIANILARTESKSTESSNNGDGQVIAKLEKLYRTVLQFSMRKGLA